MNALSDPAGQGGQGKPLTGQGKWSGQKPSICREVRVVRAKPEKFSQIRNLADEGGPLRDVVGRERAVCQTCADHPDHPDMPANWHIPTLTGTLTGQGKPLTDSDRTLIYASDEQLRWRSKVSGDRLAWWNLRRDLGLTRRTKLVPSPLSLGKPLSIVMPSCKVMNRLAKSDRRRSLLDKLPMLDADDLRQDGFEAALIALKKHAGGDSSHYAASYSRRAMDHSIWHAHPLHLSDTAIRKWRNREREQGDILDAIENAMTPVDDIWHDLGEQVGQAGEHEFAHTVLGDTIADPHALDPADVCEVAASKAWVVSGLNCLIGDERAVMLRIADGEKLPAISLDVPDAANVKRRAVRKLRVGLEPWWSDEWSQVLWVTDLDVMTVPRKTVHRPVLYEVRLPVHMPHAPAVRWHWWVVPLLTHKHGRRVADKPAGQGFVYHASVRKSELTGEALTPWSPPKLTKNRLHYVTDKYNPLPRPPVLMLVTLPPVQPYYVSAGLKTRPQVMVKSGADDPIL